MQQDLMAVLTGDEASFGTAETWNAVAARLKTQR